MANKTGLKLTDLVFINIADIKKLKQYLHRIIGLSKTVTISQSIFDFLYLKLI
jgi:hypothetical protein